MRIVLQRVTFASVEVRERIVGRTDGGFLALVCAEPGDTPELVAKAARKTAKLRVFSDENDRMNRSILDTGGSVLAVSQFTLAADCLSGNRPSFSNAAPPDEARVLFDAYVEALRAEGVKTETGQFGEHMRVSLLNDGPATFLIDYRAE